MPVTLIHDRNGGHGCAVFLQLIRVGKRHCRVLHLIPATPELILLAEHIQNRAINTIK